jgi:predicted N-acetyltransferase YhbS
MIKYQLEPGLTVSEFLDILLRSKLSERRPIQDQACLARMLAEADLIITARHEGKVVGISRAISDFSFCTYLSDLAVDEQFQKQGIGGELIARTHQAAGLQTLLVLLAAPSAETYYAHVGMARHDSCWIIPRQLPTTAV